MEIHRSMRRPSLSHCLFLTARIQRTLPAVFLIIQGRNHEPVNMPRRMAAMSHLSLEAKKRDIDDAHTGVNAQAMEVSGHSRMGRAV